MNNTVLILMIIYIGLLLWAFSGNTKEHATNAFTEHDFYISDKNCVQIEQ